jgi:hypothetical protein
MYCNVLRSVHCTITAVGPHTAWETAILPLFDAGTSAAKLTAGAEILAILSLTDPKLKSACYRGSIYRPVFNKSSVRRQSTNEQPCIYCQSFYCICAFLTNRPGEIVPLVHRIPSLYSKDISQRSLNKSQPNTMATFNNDDGPNISDLQYAV